VLVGGLPILEIRVCVFEGSKKRRGLCSWVAEWLRKTTTKPLRLFSGRGTRGFHFFPGWHPINGESKYKRTQNPMGGQAPRRNAKPGEPRAGRHWGTSRPSGNKRQKKDPMRCIVHCLDV
jgi:hypothetical protein